MDYGKRYSLSFIYGQSMLPTLRHNDKVLIKQTDPSQIKIRDILVYRSDYATAAHRVIKIRNGSTGPVFLTCGDWNQKTDHVEGDKVLGKVMGVYRKDQMKLFDFETRLDYYLIVKLASLCKELIRNGMEGMFAFRPVRKTIGLLFPLKTNYTVVDNIQGDIDFKSFYHFYHLKGNEKVASFGLMAKLRQLPVGKIWVFKDKQGEYFLYGPYVKVLYRARGIGSRLIKEALGHIRKANPHRQPYALIIDNNRAIISCLEKAGLSKEKISIHTPHL